MELEQKKKKSIAWACTIFGIPFALINFSLVRVAICPFDIETKELDFNFFFFLKEKYSDKTKKINKGENFQRVEKLIHLITISR